MMIKKGARILLLLGIILCAFFVFVVSSQTGLQWVYVIAQNVLPGNLQLEQLQGRLIGPLHFENGSYRIDNVLITVKKAAIDWQPSRLFFSRISFNRGQLHDVQIKILPSKKQATPVKDNRAIFPANMSLNHVSIDKFRYQDTTINTLTIDAKTINHHLYINQLAGQYQDYQIHVNGDVLIKPTTANLQINLHQQQHLPISLALHLHSQNHTVYINSLIQQAFQAKFSGVMHEKQQGTHWQLYGEIDSVYTQAIHRKLANIRLHGSVNLSGDPDNIYANLMLADKLKNNTSKQPLMFSFSSHLKKNDAKAPLYANAHWQQLRWPLVGKAKFSSQSGSIDINGSMNHYQVQLDGLFSGQQLPKTELHLQGQGDTKHVDLQHIKARVFDGNIHGNAHIIWQPTLSWQTQLQAEKLNLASLWPDWQSAINFSLDSQGRQVSNGINADMTINRIAGSVHKLPFAGRVASSIKNSKLHDINTQLSLGSAKLNAQAVINQNILGQWSLSIPELSTIIPWGTGEISSSGKLTGKTNTPTLDLQLAINNAALDKVQVDKLSLKGNIDLRPKQFSMIDLNANNIILPKIELTQVDLQASGNLTKHTINGSLQTTKDKLVLQAQGNYQQHTWRAQLSQLNLLSTQFGNWSLTKNAQLQYQENTTYLHDFCWRNRQQKVCLAADLNKSQLNNASFSIDKLQIKPISQYLLSHTWLNSQLNASGQFQRNQQRNLVGNANLELTKGQLRYTPANRLPTQPNAFTSQLTSANLALNINNQGVETKLAVTADKKNYLRANITLPNYHPLNKQAIPTTIHAKLSAYLASLHLLPALFPHLLQSDGQLSLDTHFDGALKQPNINGKLSIVNGKTFIDSSNTDIHQVNFTATAKDTPHIDYLGSMLIGDGKASWQGNTSFNQQGINTQLQFSGKHLRVINTRDYIVDISPQLTLAITPKRFDLGGNVFVPKANIYIRHFNSTVTLPDEAIIITDGGSREKMQDISNFYADIKLRLGNDIQLNTDSFSAKLNGALHLIDSPKRTTTATGELRILEGKFDAYGQALTINNGRLLFSNSPIDNPALNIRAEKKIKTVLNTSSSSSSSTPITNDLVVGVEAKGMLRKPEISLFSVPAGLNDADILSYLILGYPTERAQSGQTQAIWQAANALQLGGLELTKIKKQLQDTFGLDLLTLESSSYIDPQSSSIQDNTSVVLGKMLSPRLFISYSIGIILPVNTFNVTYKLSDNWSVKTDSGSLGNGADLIYTFEY